MLDFWDLFSRYYSWPCFCTEFKNEIILTSYYLLTSFLYRSWLQHLHKSINYKSFMIVFICICCLISLLFHKMFQVTMEECPSVTFTETSADKCWESVLKRLHDKITEQRSLGELELPSLELLKSINGFRMFGFPLPSIVQVM